MFIYLNIVRVAIEVDIRFATGLLKWSDYALIDAGEVWCPLTLLIYKHLILEGCHYINQLHLGQHDRSGGFFPLMAPICNATVVRFRIKIAMTMLSSPLSVIRDCLAPPQLSVVI